MANYRGHVIGGAVAYSITFLLLNTYCSSWHVALEWFICSFAGSLFPDIDTKSHGQKYFYGVLLVVFVILIAQKRFDLLAILSICSTLPLLSKHRGIFHNIWLIVLAPLVVWCLVGKAYPRLSRPLFFDALFFIVGALSHLWMDFYFVPIMRSFGLYKKRTNQPARRS